MKSFKKVRFYPDLGARPSVTLFVLGALASSLLSGFAYTPKNIVVATVPVGSLPLSLVVSPDSSVVYVGNENSKSISVINTSTNEVPFTIGVSGQPFYLAVTPDGTKLYATLLFSNAALEFSTATGQLVQSYATGSSPQALSVSPDGSLIYIPNAYDGTVSVISENSLQSPINVGSYPVAVIFSPDGSHAYVTNEGSSSNNFQYYVSVIATSTNTVSAVIQSSAVPYPFGGGAISPDGSKLYVTGIDSNSKAVVAVIDTVTNEINNTIVLSQRVNVKPFIPALTPDGRFLYVPLASGSVKTDDYSVQMVRTATNKLDGHVIVGTQPVAVAIAPDGKYAYVSNYIDGTVSVIDITPK